MKKIIAALIALSPSIALAHSGHTDSFFTAFAHPFTGIDHLLMMLCVGIFAGRIGGHAQWQLPLAFLSAMIIGWISALMGFSFGAMESGIATGLIALGAMFMLKIAMPFITQLSVVAVFAALHGMAHGAELSNATPIAAGLGMLFATALLHGLGLGIVALLKHIRLDVYREMGAMLAVFGGVLLAAA